MDMEQNQQKDLIDTTDCLEAIGVFKSWKNFLFVVVVLCMLLVQASFWLVNTGFIGTEPFVDKAAAVEAAAAGAVEQITETADANKEDIQKAAVQVAATPNEPNTAALQQLLRKSAKFNFKVEFKDIAWITSFINFVLVISAILYCLTILFSLKISLMGRLGGINHISRAFFLSLVFLVLLFPWQIPWQKFFAGEIFGVMFCPGELQSSFTALKDSTILYKVFYYFRFCGYWFIAMLPLVLSHIRTCRWTKTTLRRLEVI